MSSTRRSLSRSLIFVRGNYQSWTEEPLHQPPKRTLYSCPPSFSVISARHGLTEKVTLTSRTFSSTFPICLLLKLPHLLASPCIWYLWAVWAWGDVLLQHLLKFPVLRNPVSTGFMNWLFVLQQYPVVWWVYFSLFIHVVIVIVSLPVQLFLIYSYSAALCRTHRFNMLLLTASLMHWLEITFWKSHECVSGLFAQECSRAVDSFFFNYSINCSII